ncbi:MAG TPA: uroporphyrinogen decarboxylase family protein [Candidatus Latescibacteria bacterium]|jgi:hypothetical protein|nr:uroporphyrinogen decarboxylase family protein [Candidatus Latescibacterota bacterium]HJN30245.1 uroporphyrinogen decarboxylase family protein [Candidatus Latescibacterota bacterium]|tara:strand:- start:384 stop:1532 length:1149 start_codon:yes stop_codon:yes gene_type:complete
MNSKERVRAAIQRQPVDRVPLGFYAVDCDTVGSVLGRPTFVRDKVESQIALWEGRRDELAAALKADVVEFYRLMDCADLLLPKEAMLLPPADYEPLRPRAVGDDRWEDERGRIYQASRRANEIRCIHDPTAGERTWSVADFDDDTPPPLPDASVFEVLDHVIAELGDERYVASMTGGITALALPGGTEEGLVLHALQPEVIAAANRQSVARQNILDTQCIRPGAAGVLMEQDMAGSNGPLVSPDMFRELSFPYLRARMQHVRDSGVEQIIFHNCGNNIPLMDMFIRAGVDCYQSLQTTAGMEVGLLKESYGEHLCFWGGVPVEVLIAGTVDETRAAVRTAMERGAPGGGFILGPSHSVAFGTKYDNFLAFLDEFDRLRDRYS